MGVPVDEAGGDDESLCVDLLAAALVYSADAGDAIARDAHVGAVGGQP